MSPSDQRLLTQAEGYLELDLPHSAFALLQRVGQAARSEFDWNRLMGECHRSFDQFADALEHLRTALEAKKDEYSIYLAMGWCQKRLGRVDRAIVALQMAQRNCRNKLDDDAKALLCYNLGCYFSLAGKKEEMLNHLAAALALNPHFRRLAESESDFDPFRDDQDFRRAMSENSRP